MNNNPGRLWLVLSPKNDSLKGGTELKEQPVLEREISRVWEHARGRGHGLYPETETVWNTLSVDETVPTPDDQGTPWEPIKLREPLSYFDNLSISFKGFISALVALLKAVLFIRSDDYATDIAWPEARRLYVSTGDGNVYVSTDMGRTFTPISVGITNGDITLTAGGEKI